MAGAIYYGSKFVREEQVNPNMSLPYTTIPPAKNIVPMELEIAFVVVMLVGLGILVYGVASKFDKPLDFYPK